MATSIPLLSEERVQYEAIYDLKELYKHIHDWLVWRKYDIEEQKYTEKIKPTGKDIEILWTATRDIDEYSRFEFKLKWQIFGQVDVEVERGGAKVKMNKGEVNVYVSANLVLDWQNKWEERPFFKFLKTFYEKYLYKGTIDSLKKELWKVGWNLYNEVKAFLNLYKYI